MRDFTTLLKHLYVYYLEIVIFLKYKTTYFSVFEFWINIIFTALWSNISTFMFIIGIIKIYIYLYCYNFNFISSIASIELDFLNCTDWRDLGYTKFLYFIYLYKLNIIMYKKINSLYVYWFSVDIIFVFNLFQFIRVCTLKN